MPQAELHVVRDTGGEREPELRVDALPVTTLPLSALHGALAPRAEGTDPVHVRTLAELTDEVPPILVHRPTMRVIDGLHRLEAARLCDRGRITARLVEGDEADAFVLAVRSNVTHGLPLSVEDRKAAVTRIVDTHPLWSDRRIAATTGLAARTVADTRRRRGQLAGARVGRDGRTRPVDASAGRERAAQLIASDPTLSLRQVGRAAGISPETVRDVRAKLLRAAAGPEVTPLRPTDAPPPARPGAPAGTRCPAPVHPGAPAAAAHRLAAVSTLRKDPSLRLNEFGRMLLRLLDLHAMSTGHWNTIIDAVPAHDAETVAAAARACSVMWTDLSRRLDPGMHTVTGPGVPTANPA